MTSVVLKLKTDIRQLIDTKRLVLRKFGDSCLREDSILVPKQFINTEEFKMVTSTMIKVMREQNGQGIAAPQIGANLQILAVEFSEKDKQKAIAQYGRIGYEKRAMAIFPLTIIVNPRIRVVDFQTMLFEEGCLSLEKKVGLVSRYKTIEVEGLNERGEQVKFEISGWMARVFQHEVHHLKGLLIVDYFVRKRMFR